MDPKPGESPVPPPALRQLLPARPTGIPSHSSPPSSDVPRTGKQPQIAAACEVCRRRKTKCSGDRPKCSTCVARRTECLYDTALQETHSQAAKRKYTELELQKTSLERVYHALQSRSEEDATTILRRIRGGDNADDIARHIDFGDLLIQVALEPETRYRYEFPFRPEMPAHLHGAWNPYLGSLIYEFTSTAACRPASSSATSPLAPPEGIRPGLSPTAVDAYTPYLKPYHAAEVVNHQLYSVEPSRWTAVCSDNILMRKLLQAYFLQEHDWHAFVQKDYFLQDMARMRNDFCSPLLVNALLAAACHCYRQFMNRAEFWNPHTLGYRFLAEAKRLWELEADSRGLHAIQAGLLLNVVHNMNGADNIGWSYTVRAVRLAHRINLFGAVADDDDEKLQEAKVFTAWAIFSWQSLLCFSFFNKPLLETPPEASLPSPAENPAWYGELYLKYPVSQQLYPVKFGEIFKAKAEFRVILNELGLRLFAHQNAAADDRLSNRDASEFCSRFKRWYQALPESLSPRKVVLPGHLTLHMQYFHVLIILLRPFTGAEPGGTWERPPGELFLKAKACAETLFRVYYLRHSYEFLDTSLLSFIPPLLFMSIEDVEAARRSGSPGELAARQSTTLLLCKALHDQGKSYHLAQRVFHLVRERMCPEDFDVVRRFVCVEGGLQGPGGDEQADGVLEHRGEVTVRPPTGGRRDRSV